MKVLASPNPEYRRFHPALPESAIYRKQQFCVRTEVDGKDDVSVLYNTLSDEVLALSSEEDALWCSAPENGIKADTPFWRLFAAHDFIVPADTDMMEVLERGRKSSESILSRMDAFVSRPYSYVILTTTECNARCFYCYEKGRKKIRMTDDTALKTASFIENNYRKNGRKVEIKWFGGEPLFNMKAMDTICGYLDGHGIPFASLMISNGYLLTGEIGKKAASGWHLDTVQITLDGTEEIYNRCKAFIYPESEGSPFRRVMENILSAARNGIKVSIRMNVDSHNFENLMELTGMLAEKITADPVLREKVTAYCHPLFENKSHPEYGDRSKRVAEYDITLTRRIRELGLGGTAEPERLIRHEYTRHYCMADSPHSLMVLPDGHLGKCEHFTDDHFVGELGGSIDSDAVMRIAEYEAYREECKKCPFPPICHKLEVCDSFEKFGCVTEMITRRAETDRRLKKLYAKFGSGANEVSGPITYSPKVSEDMLGRMSVDVTGLSHCEYAVLGKNGNVLSISFVSVLELGSHSVQAIQFKQIGDMRKFQESDEELLKSISGVAEGYLREHSGDLLMMCSPADSRDRAIHRFTGNCFDKFGYGDRFCHLRLNGQGKDGKEYLLSLFLSLECPSFEDVKEAVSAQANKMIEYYNEISENGKRKGFQNH